MRWHYFRKRKHHIPLQFPIVYYFFPYTKKNLGVKVGPILIVHDGKENAQQSIINLGGFNRVGKNFLQRVIKNPKFLSGQAGEGRASGKEFIKWCRRYLTVRSLSGISNNNLINLLFQYQKQYEGFALANACWWVFLGDRIEIEINKSLARNQFKDDEIQEIKNNLFPPAEISYARKENLDFLKIVDLVKQDKIPLRGFMSFGVNKIIYPPFKKFVDKYFWIPWDYAGPEIWDEKHYFDKIKNYLKIESIPKKR